MIDATTGATTRMVIDAPAMKERGGRNNRLENSRVGTSATEETLSVIVMKAVIMFKSFKTSKPLIINDVTRNTRRNFGFCSAPST